MKFYKVIAFVAAMAVFASCDYQKYNVKDQKDLNAGNTYVYGISPDSLPRQMSFKYTPDPSLDARVNAIHTKLYGGITSAQVKE